MTAEGLTPLRAGIVAPDASALSAPAASGSGDSASGVLPVRAEHIRVRPDRLEIDVRVAGPRYRQTDAALIARCTADAPTIGGHACRNDEGPFFSAVMDHTSVPHLLEHLVIDAQARAARDEARVFAGATQWSAEDPDLARVSLSFEDDVAALRALSASLELLNGHLRALRGEPNRG